MRATAWACYMELYKEVGGGFLLTTGEAEEPLLHYYPENVQAL